jgi:hypothetical protein
VEQLQHLRTNLINQNCMKKLRADWTQEMLAIIECRIFCFPFYCPKM